jgi:molecular chaperone DnaK (HSP70)
MSKGDVTGIVLVGGSSQIPRVQQLLQDFFNGKQHAVVLIQMKRLLMVQQFKQQFSKVLIQK